MAARSSTDPDSPLAQRSSGVLLHLTALPGPHGIGDLGPAAHAFVDWLAAAGQGWWQMLPVNPVDGDGSPYAASSAFAGEELLVALEPLVEAGWLGPRALRAQDPHLNGRVDFAAVRRFKRPLLRRAFRAFRDSSARRGGDWRAFRARTAGWLDEYAGLAGGEADYHRFVQFAFDRQWRALRAHAAARGVRLLGDLPIFVDAGAVDVRAHPELFRLDDAGRPRVVTGVPPDAFSDDGQRWGHPHYAWRAHRASGWAWWRARVASALERFDALRVDHFIGFHHAWEVPAADEHARGGRWVRTPGAALLAALRRELGGLPLVAEDLGAVTPEVHRLRARFGLPGMRVLQFGFDAGGGYHRPHRFPEDSVAYTGTHDNDTARGWFLSLDDEARARVLAYTGGEERTIHWDLVRAAFTSPARLAVAPMQDLVGAGRAARFNTPGTRAGNWTWRLPPRAASRALARRLRALSEAAERAPFPVPPQPAPPPAIPRRARARRRP